MHHQRNAECKASGPIGVLDAWALGLWNLERALWAPAFTRFKCCGAPLPSWISLGSFAVAHLPSWTDITHLEWSDSFAILVLVLDITYFSEVAPFPSWAWTSLITSEVHGSFANTFGSYLVILSVAWSIIIVKIQRQTIIDVLRQVFAKSMTNKVLSWVGKQRLDVKSTTLTACF